MNTDLKHFAYQWGRVALMTLVPVVFAAFACIPFSLGEHPGEPGAGSQELHQHMT